MVISYFCLKLYQNQRKDSAIEKMLPSPMHSLPGHTFPRCSCIQGGTREPRSGWKNVGKRDPWTPELGSTVSRAAFHFSLSPVHACWKWRNVSRRSKGWYKYKLYILLSIINNILNKEGYFNTKSVGRIYSLKNDSLSQERIVDSLGWQVFITL